MRNTSGGALKPEQACFDVQHYDLTLSVDPAERSIDGTLLMKAKVVSPTSLVALDLDGRLTVHAVTSGEQKLDFAHERGQITIVLPKEAPRGSTLELSVRYGGKPRVAPRPPWQGGFTWAKTRDGRPWIATSCQGEGADLWWPCKDHPSDKAESMVLRITVPDDLVCASNGVLLAEDRASDGKRTWLWKSLNPIANYVVALNIAPYEVIKEKYTSVDGTEIPIFFWALPENVDRAKKALPEFLDHLRHLEEVCGPYPFRNEKYGIVETPHLGMEHQTIIAYGNKYRKIRFDYDWLHHHELSHEWWANLVTASDWKDMWIHEGIGTYMQALYIERKHGAAAYRVEMQSKRRGIGNRKPVAPRVATTTYDIYFGGGGDIYNKGSWIMHTMRWLLGDETFFRALRRVAYPTPEWEKRLDGSQSRITDSDGVRAILEREAGRSLKWYFDAYVHQPKLPRLHETFKDGRLWLRWELPDGLAFPLPVPVRIGDKIVRVEMNGLGGSVAVPEGSRWEIDPHKWLLRQRQR